MTDHASSCEHCGRRDSLSELGLCPACTSRPDVLLLYTTPTGGRPPNWHERLKRLADRAGREVPLFEHKDSP